MSAGSCDGSGFGRRAGIGAAALVVAGSVVATTLRRIAVRTGRASRLALTWRTLLTLTATAALLRTRGTGIQFEREHNRRWREVTGPIVEAFLHAKYFLEMAVKYGEKLEEPPTMLPSGWAAFLYLFNLR